jgi:hypothetical protein
MVNTLMHATARSNARILRAVNDATAPVASATQPPPALVIRISIRAINTLSSNGTAIWFQESHANVLYAQVGRVLLGEPHAVEVVETVRCAIAAALPFGVRVFGTRCAVLGTVASSQLPVCTVASAILGLVLAANVHSTDSDAHVHAICAWAVRNMQYLRQMLQYVCALYRAD